MSATHSFQNLSPNEIFIAKRMKVLVPEGKGGVDLTTISSAAKNLQSLGYGFNGTLCNQLRTLSAEQFIHWFDDLVTILRRMVGAHRQFEPMYPNFPDQIMTASDAELYYNSLMHYLGFVISDAINNPDFVVLPEYEKQKRKLLDEFHQLKLLDVGTEQEFENIFTQMVSSNSSLSDQDKQILRWFAQQPSAELLLPESIPQKETLAVLAAALPDVEPVRPQIRTATDVLRVAVAMSDGDVSLAEPTRFRNFKKSERRQLLDLLEQTGGSRVEDMLRWKERWIRLGERLHPGDYHTRFPKAYETFDIVRNDKPFKSFNGQVEELIRKGDGAATAQLLSKRPGDFARRLDHVLRTHTHQQGIMHAFLRVAHEVSTPVLLQMWHHFLTRNEVWNRAFFPKGNVAKMHLSDEAIPPLSEEVSFEMADQLREVLISRFREQPALGNVYLDERLRNQMVPFSQRSASKSLRTLQRGSSFDLPQGKTVRFFCWWKNIEQTDSGDDEWRCRVDLDLSASFFGPNWENQGQIAFYNLRENDFYHSGDITSAPQGACEFIDIDLKAVKKRGSRYVVMSVISYSHQPFIDLPECFCGWMIRQDPNSGEVFEAKTVQDKIDLTSATQACVPLIIDAIDRKVYWADIGLTTMNQLNTAAENVVPFSRIGQVMVDLRKPNLYELLEMHAEARGNLVDTEDNADFQCGLYEGDLTPFDTDRILSEFLA